MQLALACGNSTRMLTPLAPIQQLRRSYGSVVRMAADKVYPNAEEPNTGLSQGPSLTLDWPFTLSQASARSGKPKLGSRA